MKLSKRHLGCFAATVGLAIIASLPAGRAAAQPNGPGYGPLVKLIAAQKFIVVQQSGKLVFLDPGVYVAAFRSKLEFDVQRASYRRPLALTEIIGAPGAGVIARPLPSWLLSGWSGLARFLRMTVTDSRGKVVGSHVLPFCPNTGSPQRTNPNSPLNSPFPEQCSSVPFELGMVEGLQRGWAEDPFSGGYFFGGEQFKLKPGAYKVTVSIVRGWRRILHVTPRDATATVHVRVVKGGPGCLPPLCLPAPGQARRHEMLPELPDAPAMTSPPKADLPDLIPLPSWGISVQNIELKHHRSDSYLDFGATVWIGGNARLDVQGFRRLGTNTMDAYQYFWHNGRVVGRAEVGTMGFSGYNSWHFQQFAQYRLLNAHKSLVVRSQKVGFCIAPTDPVDMLLPHATWVPEYTGLSGACGVPSALWVQEALPVGWGDTYFQDIPHQSFDIAKLPNGTYYIEIIANPERLLFETNTRNDISLRKVIIGGTPGNRTVFVPALDGIDREG